MKTIAIIVKSSYMIIKTFITILILLPTMIEAQKNYFSRLDEYMQAQSNINDFSGTVLVAQKGKIIYEKAFGMADRENNVLNTVQTKFHLASISKEFTAACILQLVEKGKISLDDKLNKFFPDYPNGGIVTVHMLLNHSSGIKNLNDLPQFYSINTKDYPLDSVVSLFKDQPFDFKPGTQYSYSNSGYLLLAYIVERLTGQTYSKYLSENVFRKAGLMNTECKTSEVLTGDRATGYVRNTSGWRKAKYLSPTFSFGCGDLISTAEDLYKWNGALFGAKIISPALFKKMTTPYLGNYGYGLGIDFVQGHKRIGHTGGTAGFQTSSDFYPSENVYVAVLSNTSGISAPFISHALGAIVFDIEVDIPYHRKEIKIDSAIASRYAGLYKQENSLFTDTLVARNGKLYIRPQGEKKEYELKPESETLFYFPAVPDIQFLFETDAEQKVKTAYIIEAGLKKELKRLR